MLCEKCHKRTATTHLKQTVNGNTVEMNLCSECAAEQGFPANFGFDFGNFWGSLFAEPAKRVREDTVRCPDCGCSFREVVQMGRPACPTCYVTFYDRLLPSVQRIHGKTQHTGKVAERADKTTKIEHELKQLREQLEVCVANQEYEKCAQLRDRIRALEEEGDKQ